MGGRHDELVSVTVPLKPSRTAQYSLEEGPGDVVLSQIQVQN